MQRESIDFGASFARTVNVSCGRLLPALACEMDLALFNFDIDQAFMQTDLEGDVFMRLPQGIGVLSDKIVKLNKKLYGLRQASRQWFDMPKRSLLALGFEQCRADACVSRLVERGKIVVFLFFMWTITSL